MEQFYPSSNFKKKRIAKSAGKFVFWINLPLPACTFFREENISSALVPDLFQQLLFSKGQRGNGCAKTRILPPNPSVLSAFTRSISKSLPILCRRGQQHTGNLAACNYLDCWYSRGRLEVCRTMTSPAQMRRSPPTSYTLVVMFKL